jgi:DTW domain-containing protein YfiP
MIRQNAVTPKADACPACLRPREQCFCGKISPVDNHTAVLILQHPREQRKVLNSALLSVTALENAALRVGLSWPNLSAALGQKTSPASWAVCTLDPHNQSAAPFSVTDRKNRPVSDIGVIQGVVVLDGSWKQAKSMWWRNSWLLKLARIHLNPPRPSARRQSRPEALSTAEALAMTLRYLGEDASAPESLLHAYERFIAAPNRRLLEASRQEERRFRSGRGTNRRKECK